MIYTEDFSRCSRIWLTCLALLGVPMAVAGIAYAHAVYSANKTTSAQMLTIAVGILQAEDPTGKNVALRSWAVDVLSDPRNAPKLSDEAALSLRDGARLPWHTADKLRSAFEEASDAQRAVVELSRKMEEIIENTPK